MLGPVGDFRGIHGAVRFGGLAAGGGKHLAHALRLAFRDGGKRGAERDVVDRPAAHREAGELFRTNPVHRRGGGKRAPPDRLALRGVRQREGDHKPQPAEKRGVQRVALIGGEDYQPARGFRALEQLADFNVGVAVARVLHPAAAAGQCVRLVKQQDRTARFRLRQGNYYNR